MELICKNKAVFARAPNMKYFIGQKAVLDVKETAIIRHNNGKTFFFFAFIGIAKVEYNDEEIEIDVQVTESSDGALFVNPVDPENPNEFTAYPKGPLRKLMDKIGVENTNQIKKLPIHNLIGYWSIDCEGISG